MTLSSAHLLKRLEPAVRPVPLSSPSMAPKPGLETQSFDSLLKLAASAAGQVGGIQSGRQIEVAGGCDPQPPLDASQLERLAAAADVAEASGAKRALMLIDGRSFVLDVAGRTLTEEVSPSANNSVVNVDAAIRVAGLDQLSQAPLDFAHLQARR